MTHPVNKHIFKKANPTPRARPKTCKTCLKSYTPEPFARPFQCWCSVDCGIALSRKKQAARDRKRREQERAFNQETAVRRAALGPSKKELNKKVAAAEKAVRLYCRIRDWADPCISCGASVAEVESRPDNGGGHWDGGHFIGKGARPEIRLCTWNIHKQCKLCNGGENRYRHGGKSESVREGYTAGLTAKYGADRVAWLKGPHPILQPDIEYCNRFIRIFNKRARHLKKLRGYA